MRKKIALLMSVMVLCCGTLDVYAAEANIMPRAEVCWDCGASGRIIEEYRDIEEIWQVGGCMHGKTGIDIQYIIWHQWRKYCGKCHVSTEWYDSSTSTRIDCCGK